MSFSPITTQNCSIFTDILLYIVSLKKHLLSFLYVVWNFQETSNCSIENIKACNYFKLSINMQCCLLIWISCSRSKVIMMAPTSVTMVKGISAFPLQPETAMLGSAKNMLRKMYETQPSPKLYNDKYIVGRKIKYYRVNYWFFPFISFSFLFLVHENLTTKQSIPKYYSRADLNSE